MATYTLDRLPQTIPCGTGGDTVNLNPSRLYSVYHTGKDSAGAASTVDVFLQCDGVGSTEATTPETTYAAKSGKLIVQSEKGFPIPPGCSQFKTDTASGEAVLQVVASQGEALPYG